MINSPPPVSSLLNAQSVLFNRVMHHVRAERDRQEDLFMAHKVPFRVSDPMICFGGEHAIKLSLLVEEVGEVAKEVSEICSFESEAEDPLAILRSKLIRVAAVSVAWLEALESERESI